MSSMFYGTGISNLNVSTFDTSNVTNMEEMFAYMMWSPEILDLSNFENTKAKTNNSMGNFMYNTNTNLNMPLKGLRLDKIDFSNFTSISILLNLPSNIEKIYVNQSGKDYIEKYLSYYSSKVVLVD